MSSKSRKKMSQIDSLYQGYSTVYQEVASAFGMSQSAMLVLYSIANEDIITQKALSMRHFLPKQTVHSSIQSLIKLELIVAKRSKSNLRVKELLLTKKGNILADKTVRPLFEAEKQAASKINDAEMDALTTITNKHLAYLQKEIKKQIQQL